MQMMKNHALDRLLCHIHFYAMKEKPLQETLIDCKEIKYMLALVMVVVKEFYLPRSLSLCPQPHVHYETFEDI